MKTSVALKLIKKKHGSVVAFASHMKVARENIYRALNGASKLKLLNEKILKELGVNFNEKKI